MTNAGLFRPSAAVYVRQLLLYHVQAGTAGIADGRVRQAAVVVDVEDVVSVVRGLVQVGCGLVAGGLNLDLGEGGRLVLAEIELQGGALGYRACRCQAADAWNRRKKDSGVV